MSAADILARKLADAAMAEMRRAERRRYALSGVTFVCDVDLSGFCEHTDALAKSGWLQDHRRLADIEYRRHSGRQMYGFRCHRNWGIATSARPYRRSAAAGWWALVATVAVCAAVIAVAL